MTPNHACSTDLGRRSIQQDDFCVSPLWEEKAYFFGVFDGHGKHIYYSQTGTNGHKAAAYAKVNFPKVIEEKSFDEFLKSPTEILTQVFTQVNSGMNADDNVDTYMSGTTATILISVKDKIIIANVGDSRLVLGKKDGTAHTLTM